MVGLSDLIRGSNQDKLRWVFNMYDINRDGVLTKDELFQIVSSITDLMGRPPDVVFKDKENTDKVFEVRRMAIIALLPPLFVPFDHCSSLIIF